MDDLLKHTEKLLEESKERFHNEEVDDIYFYTELMVVFSGFNKEIDDVPNEFINFLV